MLNIKLSDCFETRIVVDALDIACYIDEHDYFTDDIDAHDLVFEMFDAGHDGWHNDMHLRIFRHWVEEMDSENVEKMLKVFDLICELAGIEHTTFHGEDDTQLLFWISW